VPDPIILPTIFNDDDNVVALFNIVVPETNNVDFNVTLLKLELPLTFNDDDNVTLL
jgi:hypothetical protein